LPSLSPLAVRWSEFGQLGGLVGVLAASRKLKGLFIESFCGLGGLCLWVDLGKGFTSGVGGVVCVWEVSVGSSESIIADRLEGISDFRWLVSSHGASASSEMSWGRVEREKIARMEFLYSNEESFLTSEVSCSSDTTRAVPFGPKAQSWVEVAQSSGITPFHDMGERYPEWWVWNVEIKRGELLSVSKVPCGFGLLNNLGVSAVIECLEYLGPRQVVEVEKFGEYFFVRHH